MRMFFLCLIMISFLFGCGKNSTPSTTPQTESETAGTMQIAATSTVSFTPGLLQASAGCGSTSIFAPASSQTPATGPGVGFNFLEGFSPKLNETYNLAPYAPPSGWACVAGEGGSGSLIFSRSGAPCAYSLMISSWGVENPGVAYPQPGDYQSPDSYQSATMVFTSVPGGSGSGRYAFNFEITFKDGKTLSGSVVVPAPQYGSGTCAEGPVQD